jgi:hypothetical protein
MKRILLSFLFIILFNYSFGQVATITADGENISLSKVFKTDSLLKKDQLYSIGTEWFVNVFKNPKLVMQMQDRDAGVIIGKCSLSTIDTLKPALSNPIYTEAQVNYNIKISFKDGRIKYDIYGFITKYGNEVKRGNIQISNIPSAGLISKKKLLDYYTKSYKNLQLSSLAECEFISRSIENYFANSKNKSDW